MLLAVVMPALALADPAPGYKVRMIESAAEDAREAVAAGESPKQDCAMASMQSASVFDQHADDDAAMAVAAEALEVCAYEVAVPYFDRLLDATAAALAEDPESPHPCNDFVSEFTVYFALIKDGPERVGEDGEPLPTGEQRTAAALSEKAKAVCPFAAGMMGF
ncbi:MAG: hypothetical protein QGF53_00600 [Alphaproteobacteria bacterium]|nr:hypothetical protein [Alphaproteobacteria bacterium]